MNKQELIEKFEKLFGYGSRSYIERNEVLDLVKQLDEPKPVKVPPFVAEKIEYFKKTGDWDLFQAMDYLFEIKEIKEWLEDKNNQELFARAWLDGYEVEKEKRYRVSMPKARNHKNHAQVLCEMDGSIFWCGEWYPFRTKFTRKQLEDADFGWVFDCPGIEIEEVTD